MPGSIMGSARDGRQASAIAAQAIRQPGRVPYSGVQEDEDMARIPVASRESVPEAHRGTSTNSPPPGPDPSPAAGVGADQQPGDGEAGRPPVRVPAAGINPALQDQELAMLVTARERDCQYIWNAHAASGRRAGLSDGLVDALRDKQDLPDIPEDESAVVNLGREFLPDQPGQRRDLPGGVAAVRHPGAGRAGHPDGLLCAAGLQRQYLRHRFCRRRGRRAVLPI